MLMSREAEQVGSVFAHGRPTYANDPIVMWLLSDPRFTSSWAAEAMQDSCAFLILWVERFREDQPSIKMVPPSFLCLLRGQRADQNESVKNEFMLKLDRLHSAP